MRIIDGIRDLRGRPAEIPDCSRDDLPDFFKSVGYKTGAEIGVYLGHYSKILSKSGLEIYSIDPWQVMRDYNNPKGQTRLEEQYQIAQKRLAPYPNNHIIRKTSMEALDDFNDESLDFVYIDANHRFRYVADDIHEWERKVKKGGIIAGHDYADFWHRFPGGGLQVKEIVDAWARAYDLNFWVLGSKRRIKGEGWMVGDQSIEKEEVRDRYRSWLFLKTWENKSDYLGTGG